MGIFSFFGTIGLRAKADVIMKNFFKLTASNFNDRELKWNELEAELRKMILNLAWEAYPDVFNGKFGQRPHHMTVVLVGMTTLLSGSTKKEDKIFLPILLAASMIHNDFLQNQYMEPYKNIDREIFHQMDLPLRLIISEWESLTNCTLNEEMRKIEKNMPRF